MRFTVTALGATGGRSVAAVVGDIAEYLLGPGTGSGEGREADPEGTGRYYADSGEGPGRWLGQGAAEMGLGGEVGGSEFRSVLSGRNPFTGERLITARGSAGRVVDLGAGSAVRWTPDGEALYGIEDVATVVGWSRSDIGQAVDDGEHMAARRLFKALAGSAGGATSNLNPVDAGLVLVPVVDPDGSRLIPERELARLEALVTESRSGTAVLANGDGNDELSVAAAARLVGASPSYLARLCRAYRAIAAGDTPRCAYLVGRRDKTGEWRIRRDDLAAFTQRRRQPAVRVGYDITGTTEKSFSVLALLGSEQTRRQVLAAIEAANDTGLSWLERHAASARAGGKVVGVTGWTAASWQHLTSRRLDPFVHHHNVVANTVTDEAGRRRALDARRLYRNVRAASALATAQARWELADRLGVGFRPGRRGGWEIDGIDDSVVDEFSQRSREINDAVRELEASLGRSTSLAEFRAAVASSRPAKEIVSDEAAATVAWWQRATAHGLLPDELAGCLGRSQPTRLTRRRRALVLADLEKAITAERSVFTRTDVLSTLVDLPNPAGAGPLVVPAAELEHLVDDFLASGTVVSLAATSGRHDVLRRHDGSTVAVGGDHEVEYTTGEILAVQARTLRRYASLQGTGHGKVPDALLAETLQRFPELSDEQRHLVTVFCSSGDGVQSAVGRPGTGKTHAMRAAVAAWQAAGYRVLGTTVKAEAARHLGNECGIPVEPLAWYLNRISDPAHSPFDARTVVVIDEASTIGDRDLDTLLAAAEQAGATLRFIGDPAQHGAVTAGGLWRVITERFEDRTPQLTVGRRVRHADDQRAAEALREGRAGDALSALEAAGHLHIVEGERDLYAALLERWRNARLAGRPHPMADRRNDHRLVLNRLARQLRRQMGELGGAELSAAGDRRFAVGDEVVARMGHRDLHPDGEPAAYVRNGAHGTVVAVDKHLTDPAQDRLVVDFDGLGPIVLPRAFFDEHTDDWGRTDVGVDHAYAVTSYAVQGLTYGESTSHVDPRSSRPEVYVDITRGRDANHVYLTSTEDPLCGEGLPAVPADPDRRQLEQRLDRSGSEPAAVELDPLAGPAALHAQGKTLAQLTRERRAASTAGQALAARAEQIRERQLAMQAAARPDPDIVARLVRTPEAYLAARRDRLLAAMAIYRARWEPRPGRDGPWVWALGRTPEHPDAQAEREQLVTDLEQFTLEVIERHHAGDAPLNSAAQNALRLLAADGTLGGVDLRNVTQQLEHAMLARPDQLARAGLEQTTATASSPMGDQVGVA